jgi:hypothetical protein
MTSQEINNQKPFCYFFIIVSVVVFIIVGIRCATVPFSHDETATFFYYIQSGDFLPYYAHNDANNHVLNSCLSWICLKLSGDSPFSLRLPNLSALIVLIFATFRISRHLTHLHSKLVLLAGFLLSFHWLSFYSLCRGYGLSMSFLVLSISYLIEYFNSKEIKKLFLFYLFIQIAICANLILVIIGMALTFPIILFQFLNKELLKKPNIITLLIHTMLILFWVKFSFFLQAGGQLYTGAGESYWRITFISLVELLSGTANKWMPFLMVFSFLVLIIAAITMNFKRIRTNFQQVFTPAPFYLLMLAGLIAAFYGMKIFLHINYPEDRTGLFFYVFFVLSVVFTMEQFSGTPVKVLAWFIVTGALIHFTLNVNFREHPLSMYETIPEKFYTRLLEEQKSSPEKITIGGQVGLELIYDFWNYRHGGALNIIDASYNQMFMNCDYAIAWKLQEQYYKPYYDEIDEEKNRSQWGITLLKRREKIKRNLLISIDSLNLIQGNGEFYNLYLAKDTSFKSTNPLLVEFNIGWIQTEMPVKSWLVFEIDTAEGKTVCYKRIPLNWIRYDWSKSKEQKLYLTGGQLPKKIHSLVCYLWNLEKKEIKLKINSVRIYQLEGNGINAASPTHNWVGP